MAVASASGRRLSTEKNSTVVAIISKPRVSWRARDCVLKMALPRDGSTTAVISAMCMA